MEKYTIRIEPEAIADIQEIAHWYNQVQLELGSRFKEKAIAQINQLARFP